MATKKKSQEPTVTLATAAVIDLDVFKNGRDIFSTPQELKEYLGDKKLVILDDSHPKGYAKGHIPGALRIDLKKLSRSTGKPSDPLWGRILSNKELTKKLESFGVAKDPLIVAYSNTFIRFGSVGQAVWQLRMTGPTNTKPLYGVLEP